MKHHLVVFLMGVALVLPLQAQQNYVRTFTPLSAVTPGTPLNEENSRVSTDYYDRAGRKVQTVRHRASPDGKDMADLTMYNGLGRVARRWASLPIGGINGAYVHPDVFGTCAYRGNYHIDYDYEPSSLNRLVKETNRNTRGHAITTDYLYTDKVPEFEMVNENTIRNMGTGRRTCKGVKVTDENGASRIEYTDLWGRLMMTERIGFFGDTLRTCYVYDRFDNLCCVLPPMAMEGLNEKGEYILFRDLPLRDYSYFYCYDKNGYCKAKKLPGALWTYIVNDRGGRPILVQQPMQAHKREWSFTFYDTNGRVAISGILKTSLSHKELMKWMENRLLPVSRDSSVDCGYSIPGFDISYSSFKVTQAYYYDRYEFLSTSSLFKRKFSRADTLNGYASNGFLTGKYTEMLDNGGGYELSLFNYDHRGRMIRKAVINTVSGLTTRELYTYDFCNNLISKRVAFNGLGDSYITMHSYQYDREGRETSAELELSRIGVDLKNESVSIPLHSTSYDSFGRPLNKTIFNNLDTETFTYRSDGKLQKYGGKDFRQTLRYDDDKNLFGYTSYNGSITAWNVEQGNQTYEFHMQYDGFNRLNGIASMRIPGGLKGGMSYDKNGNITSKYVGTSQKDINYLEFVYSGNHIKSIRDIKSGREPASGYGDIFYEAYESNIYSYDANGNEVANNAHNVARAHYNELNLPDTVHFLDGNMLYMRYLADGRRIQTITKTYNTIMSDPTDNVHADGDPNTLTKETHDGNVVLKNGVYVDLSG